MSMPRLSTPLGAFLILVLSTTGCVTQTHFDLEVASLRRELDEARDLLEKSRLTEESLAVQLANLMALKEQVETGRTVQTEVLDRMDRMERIRVKELSNALTIQANRLTQLAGELEAISKLPPMQTLIRLEKELADLDGQVEVNQRLVNSNRDNLVEVTRALDRHEVEFNRQMRLLGQYVQEQFVPLAEGFIAHLYEESRRMSKSAQDLQDFARRVDPYKFTHLKPGFAEEEESSPSVEPKRDD